MTALDAARDFLDAAAAYLTAAMPSAPDWISVLGVSFWIGAVAAAVLASVAGRPPRGFPASGSRFLSLSAAWAAAIVALDVWEAFRGDVRVSARWLAAGPLFLAACWLGAAAVRLGIAAAGAARRRRSGRDRQAGGEGRPRV